MYCVAFFSRLFTRLPTLLCTSSARFSSTWLSPPVKLIGLEYIFLLLRRESTVQLMTCKFSRITLKLSLNLFCFVCSLLFVYRRPLCNTVSTYPRWCDRLHLVFSVLFIYLCICCNPSWGSRHLVKNFRSLFLIFFRVLSSMRYQGPFVYFIVTRHEKKKPRRLTTTSPGPPWNWCKRNKIFPFLWVKWRRVRFGDRWGSHQVPGRRDLDQSFRLKPGDVWRTQS